MRRVSDEATVCVITEFSETTEKSEVEVGMIFLFKNFSTGSLRNKPKSSILVSQSSLVVNTVGYSHLL